MNAQQDILHGFLGQVREHHPTASRVFFETSDQSSGYGFVATGWADAAEPNARKPFDSALDDEIFLDIDWDSIMDESPEGFATISIPEGS